MTEIKMVESKNNLFWSQMSATDYEDKSILDLFMGSSSGYLVCSEVKEWRAKFAITVASLYAQYLLWLLLGTLQRWRFISLPSLKTDHFYYILDIFRSLLLLSVTQILKVLEIAVHWMLLNLWNESVDMTSDQQNFSSQFLWIWQLIVTTILILFDLKLTTLYHRWIGKVSNLHISQILELGDLNEFPRPQISILESPGPLLLELGSCDYIPQK